MTNMNKNNQKPSMDAWLAEAKKDPNYLENGMFLIHNGTVRKTPKQQVRGGIHDGTEVEGMYFGYNHELVEQVIEDTRALEGITYVRAWLNEGTLSVGDDIMFLLIGGDIRPHIIDAIQYMLNRIKGECVIEDEHRKPIEK